MKYFKIRNWGKFQHNSNRAPTWIKLYTNMINDEAGDWARWTDIQRGHIVGIWQLAAKTGNCMPFNDELIFDEIMATELVTLTGFGKHFDIYPSKRDCLASNPASTLSASKSARDSMVRCSSLSSSISSSSESESEGVSPKKYTWACRLLHKHGRPIPEQMTAAEADEIIDTLKDEKPCTGARAPASFPPDPPMTFEEKEAARKALEALNGKET